jgi:nucleoid DNA-binding protein
MLELYLSKVSESSESELAGKTYARVDYKETLTVQDMAQHMAEHNTAFSEGTITGILIDFVKCIREQVLRGNTVKINNLAIFKASVEGNALDVLYDPATDKTVTASMGTMKPGDKTGPAVQSLKLLAQATGEYTREELNKDGKLGWTDKAAAEIAAAKAAANSGSQSSPQSGSQNGSQSGSQNQPTTYALSISISGSGSASVTKDGNAVTSGASLSEDDEVAISITPAEGLVPTATINGSSIELTDNSGVYTGNFAMPGQASSLVINTGSTSGNDDGDDGLDKD